MTIGHYLRSLEQLTNQFTLQNYRDPKRQRLYLKDIDTPPEWSDHLRQILPEAFYYLNDCIEPRTGGDGAVREPNEYGQMRFGKGVAPAGDLMSSLPPEMRAENMMCYIGHEGTYTPAHREMCASLGHNIMVDTSISKKGDQAGSSIWFMTETKEREVVSEYFLSMLGHDIEVEKHFAQVNAWKKAPFNVWVVEQKVGDLILIPPLAPHQVWNRGTRTMKAAWNRTTVDTLELAIHEALPRARLVCRDEQYKNKAIIYFTLQRYQELLQRDTVEPKMWKYGRIKQLLEDFKRLFALYTTILISELFSLSSPREKNVEQLEFDSHVTCSYCRCNIFNRFLTCESCVERGDNGVEDTYDICMECYAMGRSCACISKLRWAEQWPEDDLTQSYERWRNTVLQYDGYFDLDTSPQPLEIARQRYGKKTVAEICQEQLAIRPWNDIHKKTIPEPSESEPEVNDEGRIKKSKTSKGKIQSKKDKTKSCHICLHHDWHWKMAFCTTCPASYCYGVLFRAFDLMPQTVMEDKNWKCPKCLRICSCGRCRKSPIQQPYAPKGTLLGHDTRKVADIRSVESLVDFSRTNLSWLRGENDMDPHQSDRMKKLKEKAEAEKAKEDTINDSYLYEEEPTNSMIQEESHEDVDAGHAKMHEAATLLEHMADIDPALRNDSSPKSSHANLSVQTDQEQLRTNDGDVSLPAEPAPDILLHGDSEYVEDRLDTVPVSDYAAELRVPVADMLIDEPTYPDPLTIGQNRMMGAGYYQQKNDTADRILYTHPDGLGAQTTLETRTTTEGSEFLQAILEDKSKKRKRYDEGGNPVSDEDDLEFFTSKKQKRAAEMKSRRAAAQSLRPLNTPVPQDPIPQSVEKLSAHRPSRQTAGKRQMFGDVIDVDIISTIPEQDLFVQQHSNKASPDIELATKAMDRIKNMASTAEARKRRPRPHVSAESSTADNSEPRSNMQSSPSIGSRSSASESPEFSIPISRGSLASGLPSETEHHRSRRSHPAGLREPRLAEPAASSPSESIPPVTRARERSLDKDRQAQEPTAEATVTPVQAKRRGRPSGTPAKANAAADIATSARVTKRGRRIKREDEVNGQMDGAGDDRFGSPANEHIGQNRRVHDSASKEVSGVPAGSATTEAGSVPKKRRGRPPKQAQSSPAVPAIGHASDTTPSTSFLSLKERLAKKGKTLKIRSATTRKSVSSTQVDFSVTSFTPVNAKPQIRQAIIVDKATKVMRKSTRVSSPKVTSMPDTSDSESSLAPDKVIDRVPHMKHGSSFDVDASAKISSTVTASRPVSKKVAGYTSSPAARKGPTVVRLGSDPGEHSDYFSESDETDDDDVDDEIPAVRVTPSLPKSKGRARN